MGNQMSTDELMEEIRRIIDVPHADIHKENRAFHDIFSALKHMWKADRTRELSVAITTLETAMMWLNKDRANKGLIPKTETHINSETRESGTCDFCGRDIAGLSKHTCVPY